MPHATSIISFKMTITVFRVLAIAITVASAPPPYPHSPVIAEFSQESPHSLLPLAKARGMLLKQYPLSLTTQDPVFCLRH